MAKTLSPVAATSSTVEVISSTDAAWDWVLIVKFDVVAAISSVDEASAWATSPVCMRILLMLALFRLLSSRAS
ncbi:MAG TPA: hypothetical protein PK200_10625 [Spirochaetota bacterium]|nr:hypothetical protein [Spirochaetota bacterium]